MKPSRRGNRRGRIALVVPFSPNGSRYGGGGGSGGVKPNDRGLGMPYRIYSLSLSLSLYICIYVYIHIIYKMRYPAHALSRRDDRHARTHELSLFRPFFFRRPLFTASVPSITHTYKSTTCRPTFKHTYNHTHTYKHTPLSLTTRMVLEIRGSDVSGKQNTRSVIALGFRLNFHDNLDVHFIFLNIYAYKTHYNVLVLVLPLIQNSRLTLRL